MSEFDTSNTNQDYWNNILTEGGLDENLLFTNSDQSEDYSDEDIETYYLSKINNKGCKGCNPKIMHFNGCCSGETALSLGLRVKSIKDLTDGVVYDICEFLKLNENGIWRCENYFERSRKCRNFECNNSIAKKLKEN